MYYSDTLPTIHALDISLQAALVLKHPFDVQDDVFMAKELTDNADIIFIIEICHLIGYLRSY